LSKFEVKPDRNVRAAFSSPIFCAERAFKVMIEDVGDGDGPALLGNGRR
jgi:hypothetical protein